MIVIEIGRDQAFVSLTEHTFSDEVFHSLLGLQLIMLASCHQSKDNLLSSTTNWPRCFIAEVLYYCQLGRFNLILLVVKGCKEPFIFISFIIFLRGEVVGFFHECCACSVRLGQQGCC